MVKFPMSERHGDSNTCKSEWFCQALFLPGVRRAVSLNSDSARDTDLEVFPHPYACHRNRGHQRKPVVLYTSLAIPAVNPFSTPFTITDIAL